MKTQLLIIFSIGLIGFVGITYAEESFDGYSSIDPPLSEVVAGQSTEMTIRFSYTSGSYALNDLTPIIEVNPSSAKQFVQVEVDPLEITQGQIKRIPVTLIVDPYIQHEKIFLSISYYGYHFQSDELQKSSWNDQIELDVKEILVPEPQPDEQVSENCGPGTVFQDGICVVEEQMSKTNSAGLWGGVSEIPSKISPLKQFKSGVPIDEIKCKENFVLLQKHIGSPACVKPNSVIDLIKRNWMTTEEIDGYAVDYDGDVKHLPFADICANEMKILLLTHSNISLPEDEFVMEDMELPSGMNQEDFERCAHETEFTKSRWNMVTMENPIVSSIPESSLRYHLSIYKNPKTMMQYVTPDFITIGPGEKVTWSNYDDITATMTSNDPAYPWSTGTILPDGYATITFNKTGIYEYHGKPGTNGVIVVMDDGGELLESKFSNVFGPSSPLIYADGLTPVLLYDNCERYVYWLNEHGKEQITLPEDYPRYPPWGNQIFPLVEFCTSNGEIVNTSDGNSVRWEFKVENEN